MASESILTTAELPMEVETEPPEANNLGVAMGLVILAGGATSIGAAVVFFPSLVNLANSRTLAVSLGLSAGVMIFVSFIEIFGKSQSSFEEAGFEPEQAYALAMATFFSGAFLMIVSICICGSEFLLCCHQTNRRYSLYCAQIAHYVLEKLLGHDHHDTKPIAAPSSKTADDIEAPSDEKCACPRQNKQKGEHGSEKSTKKK